MTFEDAASEAVVVLGAARLRHLATAVTEGWPRDRALGATGDVPAAAVVWESAQALPAATAGAYLGGLAAGYERQEARVRADVVWTGPSVFDVPVRATAQVLIELVADARHELILATYSAKPYQPLRDALQAATERGVIVWVVVETLHGAGSALQGDPPAAAFAGLAGISLWTWDVERRPEGAKMHAKVAIADERVLFTTSANLTNSGIGSNIEAGTLIRGGTAARRAAEHLHALRRDGALVRL